jgi:meso-butanediol dehydrogenase / (S,S)-butanediol dehydrogenase / diacetyl reductase
LCFCIWNLGFVSSFVFRVSSFRSFWFGDFKMDLKGKVALITGAGSGIGAATARRFVSEGARVCLNDIIRDNLEMTVASLHAEVAATCPGDVTNPGDVERMVETAMSRWGKLNILVNSAGIDPPVTEGKLDLALWHRIIEVNLTGPFLTMKTAIPYIIKSGGGSVINIASLAGLRFFAKKTEYSSAKGGLIALTQQAAVEYGPSNVRCNVICPGGIRTPMMENQTRPLAQMLGKDLDWLLSQMASCTPLRRVGRPEEVAAICSFLASEDSSLMTGGVLLADGGAAVVDVAGAAMKDIFANLPANNTAA